MNATSFYLDRITETIHSNILKEVLHVDKIILRDHIDHMSDKRTKRYHTVKICHKG
jgi:hypothetical protein